MNISQLKNSIGHIVQFQPPPTLLDQSRLVLPEIHDDWRIDSVVDAKSIRLRNLRTNHIVDLGPDHIKEFSSDPARSVDEQIYGFLVLKVQIYIQGGEVWLRPSPRPGERTPLTGLPQHAIQWTPFSSFNPTVPSTASAVNLQYEIWSETPNVPLHIRFSARPDGTGYPSEHSGSAGVAQLILPEGRTVYFSLSHPTVCCRIHTRGWTDRRGRE